MDKYEFTFIFLHTFKVDKYYQNQYLILTF